MADHLRRLGPGDLTALLGLASADPVVNVFVESRLRQGGLDQRWLGGQVWGRFVGDELVAGCYVGANLVPIGADPDSMRAFGDHAAGQRRTSSTIVGRTELVRPFWEALDGAWGEPRELRWRQPHLELRRTDVDSTVERDLQVRRTSAEEVPVVFPACVAMYTEEVGVSPADSGGEGLYRARIEQLVGRGWSFSRIEDDDVVFKAEVSCATGAAAQVQGVWVAPHRRGQGLGTRGMAAVVDVVLAEIAPTVSLYVNEWNTAARAAYQRIGFQQTAMFSTLMF
ncbi:GNAT family N-acetyltransferase [Nocardioides limicola]|uniref:GNAT family N-acetyltransferase n=1 Tax=Nocardioides limicola TaxID=2803368 RepID=UPI00193BCFCC|nr:GNAT family N-acetyltransferase [Nocardioides sp. DJM-14]